ncbi:hypothetical protein K2Y11_13955 [bacterium]|nr:hypothetical protein [bacterium]
MEAASWKSIFESIRVEDQRFLVIRTIDTLEIAVELISRVESEVVLIKGRIAGSADARRIFILPYDKLAAIYVNRVVANEEVALFSPSISLEEKQRIARDFEEKTRQQRESELNLAKNGGKEAEEIPSEVKAELEEIKRLANGSPGNAPSPAKEAMHPRVPTMPERRYPSGMKSQLPEPPRPR